MLSVTFRDVVYSKNFYNPRQFRLYWFLTQWVGVCVCDTVYRTHWLKKSVEQLLVEIMFAEAYSATRRSLRRGSMLEYIGAQLFNNIFTTDFQTKLYGTNLHDDCSFAVLIMIWNHEWNRLLVAITLNTEKNSLVTIMSTPMMMPILNTVLQTRNIRFAMASMSAIVSVPIPMAYVTCAALCQPETGIKSHEMCCKWSTTVFSIWFLTNHTKVNQLTS